MSEDNVSAMVSSGKTQNNASVDDRNKQVQTNY